MATRVFEGFKLFQKIFKRTMARTFLWNFIKIQQVVSEKKMFKEKVNTRTDGYIDRQTDEHTTDNRPWHKLTGLWPVELKIELLQKGGWLIEWCFTLLSTVFQSYHVNSSHYSCLFWVSPVLGRGSAQGHSHNWLNLAEKWFLDVHTVQANMCQWFLLTH